MNLALERRIFFFDETPLASNGIVSPKNRCRWFNSHLNFVIKSRQQYFFKSNVWSSNYETRLIEYFFTTMNAAGYLEVFRDQVSDFIRLMEKLLTHIHIFLDLPDLQIFS